MMAMALVSLALAIGLVLQAGLGFWLSVTVSLAFYVTLLAVHGLVRRSGQIEDLRNDVERLRAEMQQLRAADSRGQSGPQAVGAAPPAAFVNAPSLAAPSPNSQPNAPSPQQAQRGPGAPPLPPAATIPASGAPAAPSPAGARPAIVRAPASVSEAAGRRPGQAEPQSAPVGPATAATPQSRSEPPGPPQPMLPEAGDAAEAWSYRPGAPDVRLEVSPREADVEMIQGLIKKLADEVNAVEAGRPQAEPSRPVSRAAAAQAPASDRELDRSVEALKDAAQEMRARPADTARAGPPQQRPISRAEDDVITEPSRRQRAEKAASEQVQSAAQSAERPPEAGAEPEFDVEALMRRAQPIATMTSLPPPLPSAGRPSRDRAAFDADTAREVEAITGGVTLQPPTPNTTEAADASKAAPKAHVGPDAAEDTDDAPGWSADAIDAALAIDGDEAPETVPPAFGNGRMARIASALDAGRVDVFLEPILDLEKHRAVHYEVSLRLSDADGSAIGMDDLPDSERSHAVLPLLDSVRLSHTAFLARKLEEKGKQGAVFSTLAATSLTSDDFMSSLADVIAEQETIGGQLVLTFDQADVRRFRAPEWATLSEMRDFGFRFALRAVTDLDMDFEELAGNGFKFVKLDAENFLAGLPAPGDAVPAGDICRYLADFGLALVVERIDDEEQRATIFGFGVLFGQGELFGGARRMKTPAAAVQDRSQAA
ncbi:MAG: EAL domain-containing protein [Hyphomicrobiaceae bacterium]